ncbi:hypothetical protein FBU31_000301 [Coemansia sp. 'formosensis']|nr:hypothetical protein FBU31_000301 [Coemansia sp. 'formosensis']
MRGAAKWEQISKALGRSKVACKVQFRAINREQVADDREKLVTSEVQRQCESCGGADWSLVSQATGLGTRECLELSQYDVGKASWHYDPDSFSQRMFDRMTGFIKEHYPAPVPANYRAVSNYMWVDMEDCIRIHDMFKGRFKWTKDDYEQAVALRTQGLTYKEIAWRFSPSLSVGRLAYDLRRHLWPKRVQELISAEKLKEISRLVDEYAGKYLVVDIIDKIRSQLNINNRRNFRSTVISRITAHAHYKAKIRDIDFDDLAYRIATGHTTAKLAAKELDVPFCALNGRVKNLDTKLFSPIWTEEETRKLIDYMRNRGSKPDFVYFNKILGTKSSRQCNGKTQRLRCKGILPHIPNI